MLDYVRRILTSSVYDVAEETPLERMELLSARLGRQVLLKREDMQPVFSFKIRGAHNRIAQLSQAERARGVICASAGNHAQGVALSATRLGIRAVIVMPTTTPVIKINAVRRLGGEVVLFGDGFDAARLDKFTLGLAARAKRRLHRAPLYLARLGLSGVASERLVPAEADVVLTPTLVHTTPRIGYLSGDLDFDTHLARLLDYVGFTPVHNANGQPSISLPLGSTDDGRPIGVMLSARRGQERLLLELAFELEAAAPFARLG